MHVDGNEYSKGTGVASTGPDTEERATLLETIGVLYKNMHNVRPTPGQFTALSVEELRVTYAQYSKANEAYMDEFYRVEEVVVSQFEIEIDGLVKAHGIDRATAIRWDIDALGLANDVENFGIEYYEDMRGLPHGYVGRACPAFVQTETSSPTKG